jgi:hypothetical protein
MATDSTIRDHQAWLGYLQPDGLVVSPAALVDAQVLLDRNVAPLQQRFLEFVSESEKDGQTTWLLRSLRAFLTDFLEWPAECVAGRDASDPIPDSLQVPLREFGETLQPTYAFRDPSASEGEAGHILLVQNFPPGTDLDAPVESAMAGWSASQTRRFERLLRETRVPIGLISNHHALRIVYAPRGENAGTLTFPVSAMAEIAGRPILAALEMLLSSYRLLSAPTEARLPALLKRSRDYQGRVSTQLAQQVLDALYELLRGFQAADGRTRGELLRDILAEYPDSIYNGLLTVLMRLVFLLYAEDRALMPGSDLYVRNYAIHGLFERLRSDAEHYPDTMDHRYGAWAQLAALFRVVFTGCDHPHLKMPARLGHLFEPDRFPFLEGRTTEDQRLPLVSDGHVYRVLDKLLMLDGERLSYRTLDVEQIGSVYETMMGFKLQITPGQAIALKPAKAHGAPVPVNLEELLAAKASDRAKLIQDQTDYKLTTTMNRDVKAAESIDGLLAALERRIARSATPQPVPAGTMVLMPTDERRKTGSHYTPRSLTEPIVAKALEPILAQLGEHPTPDDILSLKVCDPAMGSGAFLVEACRQLAEQLVAAWAFHGYKPRIPEDEDEVLYARRLIAQRCLYGVDRNPMAVDLAKLSLWLATLAKDHPFTFLDHALRAGDSLVGLTRSQIALFSLDPKAEPTFVQGKLHEQMTNALRARRQILAAGDDMPPAAKAQKLALADEALDPARLAGDLFIASFFDGEKAAQRTENRDEYLGLLEAWKRDLDADAQLQIQAILTRLRGGQYPVAPFHWELEYPEVFDVEAGGFDAIVGNPPYAGHVNLATSNHEHYTEYLRDYLGDIAGKCDLIGYFFRRLFLLVRKSGTLGLLATSTVRQGDTRSSGLRVICKDGGDIYSARRRFSWPGQASVQVCSVHIYRGEWPRACHLDGKQLTRITAYLFHTGPDDNPEKLTASTGHSFQGVVIRGVGFLFDDSKAAATEVAQARSLLRTSPRNAQIIKPFIGGDDFLASPTLDSDRLVMDFGDREEAEARQWPALFSLVESKVKPARLKSTARTSHGAIIDRWWQFGHRARAMYQAIAEHDKVLACPQTSSYPVWGYVPTSAVLAQTLVVTDLACDGAFAVLQSRLHEGWAVFFCSTLEERFRYWPTDAFETFPFPSLFLTASELDVAGRECYEFRRNMMIHNGEGLTATYNRFHDPAEGDAEIMKLRELHDDMDRAVLDAYTWRDIKPVCGFGLDYLDVEDEDMPEDVPEQLWWPTTAEALAFAAKLPQTRRRLPWRYRWPEETRDEVLARLLELNKQRAEEERRTGEAAAAAEKKAKKTARKKRRKSRTDDRDQAELFGQ